MRYPIVGIISQIPIFCYFDVDFFLFDCLSLLGLSKLIQNTLLYGDLALRFPTFVHRMYDSNKHFRALMKWCFEFVNATGVTNGTSSAKTINLVSAGYSYTCIF